MIFQDLTPDYAAPQPGKRAPGWGNLLIHNGHLTSARFDGQDAHSP